MERIGECFIWLVIVLGGAALSIGSYQADAPKFFVAALTIGTIGAFIAGLVVYCADGE